jgi:hypothetical protein
VKCREKNLKPIMHFIPCAFVAEEVRLSDLNPKKNVLHAPKSLAAFFAPIKAE